MIRLWMVGERRLTPYDSPDMWKGFPLNREEKVSWKMNRKAAMSFAASSVLSIVCPKSAYEKPTPTLMPNGY